MKIVILALALFATTANAVIRECNHQDKIVYKYKPQKKNHITLLAGTGYFEENYHVEWFPHQEDKDPIVTNYWDAIGGLQYQRFVTEWASMSFVVFSNQTVAMGIGFSWD